MKPSGHFVSIAILVVAAICCYCAYALETRTSPQALPRQGRLQKQPPKIDPSCGTSDDLTQRVAVCAKPLMDLLQGTVKKWLRTEDDAMELCDSYAWSERCIRDSSRKCGKGIQKTIISTLATSIGRVRKRECSRAKAPGIVRTTMCLEREQAVIQDWMRNVTGRLTFIEQNFVEGDKKITGICCMINDIEKELKEMLSPKCNEEAKYMARLYHMVLEDAVGLICRNPRCNNYLRGYKPEKAAQAQEMIAIILRIVFSLDNNEN